MKLSWLEILLVATSLLEFNPLFQAVKSLKSRKVANVSPYTFLSIMMIGTLWLVYGIQINSLPLIAGNVVKLFSSTSVVAVYCFYNRREKRNK